MTAEVAAIRRAFGPEDLRPLLVRAQVDRTILVQTRASLDETREFLAIASATDFVAGVVGWVDLTSPTVAADLAALRASNGGRRLCGIRHQVHDERDADWLLGGPVLRGLAAVRDRGLTFDLLVRERELPAALAVVRRFPDLRFVLDHAAKPPIATRAMPSGWADGITQLAAAPNVWCKLSGLVTEADWRAWTLDDLRPYVAHIVTSFGPSRIVFGSDWPVCLLAASYERVAQAARRLVAELVAHEKQRAPIFGANAVAAYELRD